MRCDDSETNGVHDVGAIDFTTPITVVATHEDSAHVLRPVVLAGFEITRRLDGDELVVHRSGRSSGSVGPGASE